MDPIRHVLVAVDFHGPSLHALEYGARLARGVGGRLSILHVREHATAGSLARSLTEAERELIAFADVARADGAETTTLLADGAPADAILAAARESGADLLVLGSHGRRGLSRALLGSVAEDITRRAALPVTILHEWRFESRADAAARLAKRLAVHKGEVDLTIALGRGAVPIAVEVAQTLATRVETYCVEPIRVGATIVGAVGEDDEVLLDDGSRQSGARTLPDQATAAIDQARAASRAHASWLRSDPLGNLTGYSVLLVADAVITPAIVRVAARAVRGLGASRVSLAVPVCAASLIGTLPPDVDRTLSLETAFVTPEALRIYREDEPPANIEASEMLIHAAAPRA